MSRRAQGVVRAEGLLASLVVLGALALVTACGGGGGGGSDVDVDVATFVFRPTSGPLAGGTTVTIEGAGFTNPSDTTVLFGGVGASVIDVPSGEVMVVRIPGAPGGSESVVDVSIQNSLIEVVIPQAFFYVGAPQISSISPASVSVAGGDRIRIFGRNFTEASDTLLTIGGRAVTDLAVPDSGSIQATVPPGESLGEVPLVIQNRNGSTSSSIRFRMPPSLATGRRHEGTEAGAGYGSVVAALGDLDGDGFGEYGVGIPGSTLGGSSTDGPAGAFQLFAGIDDSPLLLQPGSAMAGEAALASSLAALDWGNDGVREVAAGAPASHGGVGEVQIVSLDGSRVATIAAPSGQMSFGRALGVGDFNGDTVEDLVVGMAGMVSVFSGTGGGSFLNVPSPDPTLGDFGAFITVAGDMNVDGTPELIIGARGDNQSSFGGLFVISGADGSVLNQIGGPGFGIDGLSAALDDWNGDSVPDYAYTSLGRVLVLSGQDHSSIRQITPSTGTATRFQSMVSATDLDGDERVDLAVGFLVVGSFNGGVFIISSGEAKETIRVDGTSGQDQKGDRLGSSIASGDLDRDGLSEVIVGAVNADGGAGNDIGSVETYSQHEMVVSGAIRSGGQFDLHLAAKNQGSAPFQVLVSTTASPGIPVGPRTIPVGFPDPFVSFSFTFPAFSGQINAQGYARTTVVVPPSSIPSGATFYGAFFTADGTQPLGVGVISHQVPLTFE
ncbi:MAG: IPT/TIG domain-containing protein [Planctomycetota bacterium]